MGQPRQRSYPKPEIRNQKPEGKKTNPDGPFCLDPKPEKMSGTAPRTATRGSTATKVNTQTPTPPQKKKRNTKAEALKPEPVSRNPNPETRNPKPENRNPQTRNTNVNPKPYPRVRFRPLAEAQVGPRGGQLGAVRPTPKPCTLHPAPYTLHPTPYTPNPKP